MSPLARERRNTGVTERFEMFVAGRELCNAYSELNDPRVQASRFASQQSASRSLHHLGADTYGGAARYCHALESGLPPTGGCGVGIDRLVMLFAQQRHIRDVILFSS